MNEINPFQPRPQAPRHTLAWIVGIVALIVAGFATFVLAAIVVEREQSPILTPNKNQASAIVALSPDVSVKSRDSQTFSTVIGDISVEAGAEVRTSPTARAFLVSPNGALTVIKENSHLVIAELGEQGNQTRLVLLEGAIRARVERLLQGNEYYEVQSSGIVTSVRGTEFEMERVGESTAVTVVRNEVALSAVDANGGAGRIAHIVSGEKILLDKDSLKKKNLDDSKETLSPEELRSLINASEEIGKDLTKVGTVLGRLDSRSGEDNSASAGVLPGSPLYGIERFAEIIGTAATRGKDAKITRNLALAEERLLEALALAKGDNSGVERALDAYKEKLASVLASDSSTDNGDIRELIARSTLLHQEVLDSVLAKVPEEARFAVLQAQAVSEQGNREAIKSLGDVNPKKALDIAVEAMRFSLKSAQEESALNNSLSASDAIRRFDNVAQLASDLIPEKDSPDMRILYSNEVYKALTVIETLDELSSSLLPGIARSVDEVRTKSIKNQIASIASLEADNPEDAVEVFAKTSNYYLEKLSNKADSKSDKNKSEGVAEAFVSYSKFGADMASLARGIRTGDTDVRELVQRATEHHEDVLSDVRNKLPENVQPALDRAESADKSVQSKKPVKNIISEEEFKQRYSPERAKEETAPKASGAIESTDKDSKVAPTPNSKEVPSTGIQEPTTKPKSDSQNRESSETRMNTTPGPKETDEKQTSQPEATRPAKVSSEPESPKVAPESRESQAVLPNNATSQDGSSQPRR